uniref:Uncharacterized protein n=1 Tax=Paramoeba aestuarina TaxID=180227 RepID=A0A7S4P1P8_9EUKA|mmetsp:Transcript_34757/g.54198  ORF Transcript_34757/g.54198 Transcript_34757/m.54198 type:complete len:211 (+) Transcript_34757:67-699(+)|eukprot:CAMPEP_0201519968 /NCGR_PEP_ID=MMETSP0161_2-20130828/10386_1 /ASSEMBLY_ACC=CAM_ASM_000251 /TAXON_ID=180227 /ORGANISM="Neoparamoeba aestuarina, Strain SoJaBio B1-5/56/2" /LENGTH=210 /DNA_ID=CAMNT_0047918171 /DNA_START=69 /DNA_END=701 /DNA_ORIENTATION=+
MNKTDDSIEDVEMDDCDKEDHILQNKQRAECLGQMEKIVEEFGELKERFFEQKLDLMKLEMAEIKSGTNDRFLRKCKQLEEFKDEKLWATEMWRQYQIENVNSVCEYDKKVAEDEYQTAKRVLFDQMVVAMEEKVRRLEDERTNMALVDPTESRSSTRKLRSRNSQKTDIPNASSAGHRRKANLPSIEYELKESEIMDDLHQIQLKRSGR